MRLLVAFTIVLILAGCGFRPAVTWSQLDGPVDLLSDEPYSPIHRALDLLVKQSLAELDSTPKPDAVRRILLKPMEKNTRVLSVDSNGRPAEYQVELVQEVTFTIDDLEQDLRFSQSRDYVYDVRDILAYQRQVEQFEQAMTEKLAQQILYAFSAKIKEQGP